MPCHRPYLPGWRTIIENDTFPKGLDENVVRAISAKKKEPAWMLEFRLKAFKKWLTMSEPAWSDNEYPTINYQVQAATFVGYLTRLRSSAMEISGIKLTGYLHRNDYLAKISSFWYMITSFKHSWWHVQSNVVEAVLEFLHTIYLAALCSLSFLK